MAVAHVEFATKVLVPRRREDVIRRQRLIDLLHEHVPLRLQVVSAPAGYGKTTLLVDFSDDVEIPICWYSLDASDQDPKLLLEGILASVNSRFPGFGQLTQSRLLTTEDVGAEAAHLVGTLVGEIYGYVPDYFVLVLEDYHLVEESEQAKRIIDIFLSRAPENCHMIISSRTPVELTAMTSLTFQRRATSLGRADLAFIPIEVRELLAKKHGLELSDTQAEKLATETEGWIAGILLSAYQGSMGMPSTEVLTLSRQDIFEYLASEVYERQPSHVQEFLLRSSTVDEMEPELCDSLLGSTRSRRLLCEIERRNLFTNRIEGEKTWYRYHQLFRQFLQTKFLEENPEDFERLHSKAASLFERQQRWSEAFTHFLTAKRYDQALRVLKTIGEEFVKSGKWTTVLKWVEALPTDMRRSDPELVLLYAQSLIHVGEVDRAAYLLTQLLDHISKGEEWLYKAKALSWRSAAFRLTGHSVEAKSDISAAIRLLEQRHGPAPILGDAYRRLGDIHAEQGHLRLALKHQRRALRRYSSTLDVGPMALVHNSLGIIYRCLGDLTKANVHLEHARIGWERVKNYGALAMTLNNMGITYQCQGQYDLALETLRVGLQKARESGYRRTEACVLISMADVLRDLGLYDDAMTAYREGIEIARQVMEAYFVACATAGIGETYRLIGARDKAEVLLKEAVSEAEERGQSYEAALFTTQLGIIEYERGHYDIATDILLNASKRLAEIGDKHALAKAYFHLAHISFLSKKYEAAISWLDRASGLADELGYEDFLAVEGRGATLLIQYGASKGVGGNRFARIMDRIRKCRDNNRVTAAELSVAPFVTVRPDIEAQALGESVVLINGRKIADVEWRSNRAKEMFFYLLCSGVGQTNEQIITALWPDLAPAKGSSNLHINLYRARRAVYPGILTLEQGRYKLNPDVNLWFDVIEFEAVLLNANNLPPDSDARAANLERAIQLYKGSFLEDFYSEWTNVHRRQIEDKYLKGLSLLADFYGHTSQYDKAIALLEKFIVVDPYQDEVYCQMIEWHLAAGDRTSALRTYERCIRIVGGETLGIPTPRMQELHKRILMAKEST